MEQGAPRRSRGVGLKGMGAHDCCCTVCAGLFESAKAAKGYLEAEGNHSGSLLPNMQERYPSMHAGSSTPQRSARGLWH